MSNLVKESSKSLMSSKSTSGAVGKGMVLAGGSYLMLSFVIGLIPFVGPVLAAAILIGLGLFMWE
jgi:hypothetical protein